MISKKKFIISLVLSIVLTGVVVGLTVWIATGGYASFMPPVTATLPVEGEYGEDEKEVLNTSESFWTAMENADEAGMRAIADKNCTFVHIGMTCGLDEEIGFYTSGSFKPTKIEFHGRNVKIFNDSAIVITDCDYSLKIGGMSTTHHFAVTEAYVLDNGDWKLIQFSFTALVS